jgi:hypothetical protein
LLVDGYSCERQRSNQVLNRRQIIFQGIGVADENQLAPVLLAYAPQVLAAPTNRPRSRGGQAGKDTQQAGLPYPIVALHSQYFARAYGEAQPLEKTPIAADAAQIDCLEHEMERQTGAEL